MSKRPAFVQVPIQGGGSMTAVVATRDGIAEVDINGVPHIGLLLSVNTASATIAVLTPDEASRMGQQLGLAAVTLARRLAGRQATRTRRDVTELNGLTHLHRDDTGAELFQVLDEADKPVPHVVEANTEEGWIFQELRDDAGDAELGPNGEVRIIRVRGKFSIRRMNV